MKKLASLRYSLLAAMAITGTNILTGCNSCNRDKGNGGSTTDTIYETETDTIYVDTNAEGGIDRSNGTGHHRGHASGGSSSSSSSSSTKTSSGSPSPEAGPLMHSNTPGSGSSATGKKKMSEAEITDRVENSSSNAVDSKGRPVNSGGTTGSGQGNGTISTGNNGTVHKLKDQEGN